MVSWDGREMARDGDKRSRYFQLEGGEGGGSQVFNFVVTKSVTREFGKSVVSKEFEFGFHRWALSFAKADKVR